MRIRVGYELTYNCPQETPMILTLNVHYSRASDVVIPDYLTSDPAVPVTGYRDGFGNWCNRIVAPAGRIQIRGSGVVTDHGRADPVVVSAHGCGPCRNSWRESANNLEGGAEKGVEVASFEKRRHIISAGDIVGVMCMNSCQMFGRGVR